MASQEVAKARYSILRLVEIELVLSGKPILYHINFQLGETEISSQS